MDTCGAVELFSGSSTLSSFDNYVANETFVAHFTPPTFRFHDMESMISFMRVNFELLVSTQAGRFNILNQIIDNSLFLSDIIYLHYI